VKGAKRGHGSGVKGERRNRVTPPIRPPSAATGGRRSTPR
jgi:hypothetical protein